MSDFITSLLANAAESAIEAAAARRRGPAVPKPSSIRKGSPARPWRPPELAPTIVPAPAPAAQAEGSARKAAVPRGTVVAPAAPANASPASRAGLARRLFSGTDGLLRTVIAAEILGPPVALRDNPFDPRRV